MTYKPTRLEQETIINFNEQEDVAEIFTYNNALKRKLHTLCDKFPDQFIYNEKRSDENGVGGEFFKAPKKYIKVASPRVLTAEQQQKKREQAKRNLSHTQQGKES